MFGTFPGVCASIVAAAIDRLSHAVLPYVTLAGRSLISNSGAFLARSTYAPTLAIAADVLRFFIRCWLRLVTTAEAGLPSVRPVRG